MKSRRIDAFELWCWRRLLRVPWTARRSNQSILKEISPGISFGRTDAKAETPILWPSHAKSWHIGKDWCLRSGGEGDDRGWDGWMATPTRWTWVWVNSGIWWWTGRPGVLQFMGLQSSGHSWVTDLIWSDTCYNSKMSISRTSDPSMKNNNIYQSLFHV